jgi:hypothetical protein
VQDPVANIAGLGRASGANDSIYLEWRVDIKNDGTTDVLLTAKLSSSEVKELQKQEGKAFIASQHGFVAYLGIKSGGYVHNNEVEEAEGSAPGGLLIDIAHCYVGYVDELKQFGIVTMDTTEVYPERGRGPSMAKEQIYCYTVKGDHIKRTDLTPVLDEIAGNPIYEKYLTEPRRTHVDLKEVSP